MIFPDEFRRIIDKNALPTVGEELAGPLLVIVEAVVLEVGANL
jgi:hypothetical protein